MKRNYYKHHMFLRILIVFSIIMISIVYTGIQGNNTIMETFSNKKELPIYSVERGDIKLAISFDAAWGDDYTMEILNILDKYNVKSTFFLVGFWVDKYPNHVKEIYKRGHDVGNHSTNHPYMTKLSEEEMAKELNTTGNKIKELIKEKPILFRPPFGDYNDKVIKVCRNNGYYVIQWDVDSLDWKEMGVQAVVDRVVRNVKNGSIVLFHNNAKYVLEYLPIVIERLQKEGYEIVPISELIHRDNFYMDSTGRQILEK